MASLAGAGHLRVGLSNATTCSSCISSRHGPYVAARYRRAPGASTTTRRLYSQNSQKRPRFSHRLREALKKSKVEWYGLPIGVGIGFVGLMQFYKTTTREQERRREELGEVQGQDGDRRPKRRERIRPDGPWQVQVMSTLPLKAISRLWGRFNELEIPYYLRVPGFKLYSFIFGVKYVPSSLLLCCFRSRPQLAGPTRDLSLTL